VSLRSPRLTVAEPAGADASTGCDAEAMTLLPGDLG
jgi:hypothetical protein